ncbi:Protein of unknown function [Gryllus bimaculatus]|nr:Protein of unknown function [Gryllus bimaculatus]
MWPIYQCHVANIIVTNKYPGNASHPKRALRMILELQLSNLPVSNTHKNCMFLFYTMKYYFPNALCESLPLNVVGCIVMLKSSEELNPDLEPRSTWCQRFPLTVLNNNKRASKLTNMRIREAFQIRQHNSKLLLNYKYVEKLFVKCFEYIVLSIFSTKTEI